MARSRFGVRLLTHAALPSSDSTILSLWLKAVAPEMRSASSNAIWSAFSLATLSSSGGHRSTTFRRCAARSTWTMLRTSECPPAYKKPYGPSTGPARSPRMIASSHPPSLPLPACRQKGQGLKVWRRQSGHHRRISSSHRSRRSRGTSAPSPCGRHSCERPTCASSHVWRRLHRPGSSRVGYDGSPSRTSARGLQQEQTSSTL